MAPRIPLSAMVPVEMAGAAGPRAVPPGAGPEGAGGVFPRPDGEPAEGAASGRGPLLTLTLFLLLAGFFAGLLARARPDAERTRAVVASLVATFGRMEPAAAGSVEDAAAPPLGRWVRPGRDGLEIALAGSRLFDSGGRIPRGRWFLFARLAAATRAGWRLEVLAPVAPGAPAPVARFETVRARLRAAAADAGRVAFGLRPAGDGIWRFRLRREAAG